MDEQGRNLTPDRLPREEFAPLEIPCSRALQEVVDVLTPRLIVGIGAFAGRQARRAMGPDIPVGEILHPSPASPAANRGWVKTIERQLAAMGFAAVRGAPRSAETMRADTKTRSRE